MQRLLMVVACVSLAGCATPLQFANQGLESTSQQATAAVIVPATFLGIDLLAGGAYKLPSQVQVVLKPVRQRVAKRRPAL